MIAFAESDKPEPLRKSKVENPKEFSECLEYFHAQPLPKPTDDELKEIFDKFGPTTDE